MIVTFDASILVRATKRSTGPARKVVDAITEDSSHVIALSHYILAEVRRVLNYPKMQAAFRLTTEEIHEQTQCSIPL